MKQVCVITGGGGGLGLAAAKIAGREHHLLICDVDAERLEAASSELRSLGIEADAILCDTADESSVQALVARAVELGRVRSVIHTAGMSPRMAEAERIMAVNALGTVNVNEAFLETAEEGLCVVNVASMSAYMAPRFLFPKRKYRLVHLDRQKFFKKMVGACSWVPKRRRSAMAYLISKSFVVWYSRTEAGRFGEKGARILSVSPGSIDTEMGRLEGEDTGRTVELAAIKRPGRPEEIAELLVFCAGPRAGYLTGTDILCDGGTVACTGLSDYMRLARCG